jgi:putative N6-adenine-specific DNA methylase
MISVDASGELMHKRGDREEVGRAPLRETWAAAVVQRLRALLDRTAESSWMWIEPMAGTAVFAREWRAERPQRDWALGRMILFRQHAELASESDHTAHVTLSVDPIAHWCFAESNPARRQGLKVWLAEEESATLADSSRQLGEILNGVLASSSSRIQAALPRVVVVNPPWGVRLKSPEAVPTRAKQAEFLEDLEKNFGPAIVAVVFPRTREGLAGAPAGWREMKPLQFKVGGLPVVARFFEVRARLPR